MRNVLLLTIDDLRYDYSHIILQKINEVLGEGLEFENLYGTGTSSIFSFLGLLCSKYSISPDEEMAYVIKDSGKCEIAYDLNKIHKRTYLTEVLKKNNYDTYAIANVPFIGNIEYRNSLTKFIAGYKLTKKEKTIGGIERIFSSIDEKIPFLYGFANIRKKIYRIIKPFLYGTKLETPPYCSAKEITKLILDFAKEKNNKPKFIHAHYLELHMPFFSNGYLEKKFEPGKIISINKIIADSKNKKVSESDLITYKKMYSSQADYVGNNIKELLVTLKEQNFLKDTLIVITADHGQFFEEHNLPNGHGTDILKKENDLIKLLHEEITHLPLIIYGLEKKKVKMFCSQIAIAPTILDVLGIDKPSEWYGDSLLNFSSTYCISEARSIKRNCYSIRTDEWSFLYDESIDEFNLYRFKAEDQELADQKFIVAKLKELLTIHKKKKNEKWKQYFKNEINSILKKKKQ